MLILTLRTDKPEAELGLFEGSTKLAYSTWSAHLQDLAGIAIYKGPGSFTGLRIGLSVANTLADSLQLPIVSTTSKKWIETACARLEKGENEKIALPEYGAEPHITKQKK